MKLIRNIIFRQFFITLAIVVAGVLLFSCANRAAGPTGGPKDTIPPVVLKTNPLPGTLNYKKKLIEISFDENIQLEKATENVIVSPAQIKSPDIRANGKNLTLELQDELTDSTTYTVNFGNAIVDLNEKNPLKNYSFSFATGNEIDTLKISGIVISAETLSPAKGIYVGIYKEDNDSVFFKQPFLRIAKTDETGRFTIENIKKGKYRVYALGDVNRDYMYQPGEDAAFIDSLVTPNAISAMKNDTIWKDSVTIDTIKNVTFTNFQPQNILFKLFRESYKRQYLVKSERKQPECFTFYYNTTQAKLPEIKPLNFDWEGKYIVQKNATLDSLTYWITDTLLVKQDTLQMQVTYLKTDTLNKLVPSTDTLSMIMRHPKINAKQKNISKKDVSFKFNTNLSPSFDKFNAVVFKFESPLKLYDLSKIHLNQKIDSTEKSLKVNWQSVDSTSLIYRIDYKWEPEQSYELKIDSAAFIDIYENVSNQYSSQFKIKSLDEYSGIKIILEPALPKVVFQALDAKDKVIAQKKNETKVTKIEFLKPGDYYLRLFIDENENGKWDPGDVKKMIAPETVYYYPNKLSLMANWEFEVTWNANLIPLLRQKPKELYEKQEKTSDRK